MHNTHSVFVYGTLLFPGVTTSLGVVSICSETAAIEPAQRTAATLHGYQRYSVGLRPRGNFPAIVPAEETVRGELLLNVTEESLERLDEFEGIAAGYYSRERVPVSSGGADVEAWTYVCGNRLTEHLDGPWDPDTFQREELEWYLANVVTGRR